MAHSSTQPRIMKTPEEKAYLRQMIESGMKSVHDVDKLQEAMRKTGFTRKNILQFIKNENTKLYRGRIYKRKADPEKLTPYHSVLAMNEDEFAFDGLGKYLGDLTKRKAAKYQQLKKSAKGRQILDENLRKQREKLMASELTEAQKYNRARGCFNRVEKETDVLSSIGFKAAMICSQPTKRPVIMGNEHAVTYFAKRGKLMNGFDNEMTYGTGQLTSKQRQKLLRQRVQNLFNTLYAAEYGLEPGTKLPYTQVEKGELVVVMRGLPHGIEFQRPTSYSIPQLEDILKSSENLSISRTNEDGIPHPSNPLTLPQPIQPTQQSSDENSDMPTPLISVDVDLETNADPEDESLESAYCIPHEPLAVALDKIRTEWRKQQDKEISSPEETRPVPRNNDRGKHKDSTIKSKMQPAMKKIKHKAPKPIRASPRTDNPSTSSVAATMKTIDGQRIKQLYLMTKAKGKKTRKWFDGTLFQHQNDSYKIEFDLPKHPKPNQKKETSIMSQADFDMHRKDGTIVLI